LPHPPRKHSGHPLLRGEGNKRKDFSNSFFLLISLFKGELKRVSKLTPSLRQGYALASQPLSSFQERGAGEKQGKKISLPYSYFFYYKEKVQSEQSSQFR
jgi:hypothetical protein